MLTLPWLEHASSLVHQTLYSHLKQSGANKTSDLNFTPTLGTSGLSSVHLSTLQITCY